MGCHGYASDLSGDGASATRTQATAWEVRCARRYTGAMTDPRLPREECTMSAGLVTLLAVFGICLLRPSRALATTQPATPGHAAGLLGDLLRSKPELVAENAPLRQQIIVLRRRRKRPALTGWAGSFWCCWPGGCARGVRRCSSSSPRPCCAGTVRASASPGGARRGHGGAPAAWTPGRWADPAPGARECTSNAIRERACSTAYGLRNGPRMSRVSSVVCDRPACFGVGILHPDRRWPTAMSTPAFVHVDWHAHETTLARFARLRVEAARADKYTVSPKQPPYTLP